MFIPSGCPVISRVADNCFWFGRYVERAESTARLLQVTRDLAFDADLSAPQCWQPLLIVSGEHPRFTKAFGADATGNGELVQQHMTWVPDNPVSLLSSVRAGREIARTIRETLSLEVWEEVNELFLWLTGPRGEAEHAKSREDFYRHIRRSTQLCLGLVRSTMLHDEPMYFLWLGVMLERVGQIARILDMHHHTLSMADTAPMVSHQVVELTLWLALLRACSGYETFMKRNQGHVSRSGVASFLVFERQFPRSLRYGLRSALGVAANIWPPATGTPNAAVTRLQTLCEWLDGQKEELGNLQIHALLTHVVDETSAICGAVQQDILGPQHPATIMTSEQ